MKKKYIILSSIILLLLVACGIFLLFNDKESKDTLEDEILMYDSHFDDSGDLVYLDGDMIETTVNSKDDIFLLFTELADIYLLVNPEDEIKILSETIVGDTTYYKVQQKHNNLLVYGSTTTVAVQDSKVHSIVGGFLSEIDVEDVKVTYAHQIEDFLIEHYGESVTVDNIEKYIISKNQIGYTADIFDGNKTFSVLIESETNEIISVSDYINNVYSYDTEDYFGNDVTINLNESFYNDIDFYQMYDTNRKIKMVNAVDYGFDAGIFLLADTPISVMLPESGLVLFNEETESPNMETFAITTMNNFAVTYDYYNNIFGHNSIDNNGAEIIVNLGISKETNFFSDGEEGFNAAYMGLDKEFYIGNMNDISLGVSLDIVAHEYTHGVIHHTTDFIKNNKDVNDVDYTGIINEGYADVLGSIIEGDDWVIGNDIFGEIINRNISNPHSSEYPTKVDDKYYYPTGMADDEGMTVEEFLSSRKLENVSSYDGGGKHHNSTVVSYAFVNMYEDGIFKSKDDLAKVMYHSLHIMPSDANYEDCALAFIAAASLNGYNDSLDKIKNVFYENGMLMNKKTKLGGTITANQEFVQNAKINFINIDNVKYNYVVRSDENGEFNIELPFGEYLTTVEASGYITSSKNILLDKNEQTLNYELESTITDEKLNIALLIDNSASMLSCEEYKDSGIYFPNCDDANNDPNYLRIDFVEETVYALKDYDVLYNVGVFTGTYYPLVYSTSDYNAVLDKLPEIKTGEYDYNGTNFSGHMYHFALNMNSEQKNIITLLTDGRETSSDNSLTDEQLNEIKDNNVKINTVCLGNCNYSYLRNIAEVTGGQYIRITGSTLLTTFAKASILNSIK